MNVLVINQYSINKGDRAILYFIIRELKKNNINSITVSTHDRKWWENSEVASKYSVKFVPWGLNIERPDKLSILRKKILGLRDRFVKYRYYFGRELILRSLVRFGLEKIVCNSEFLKSVKNADIVVSTGGHHVTTLLAQDAVSSQLFDMGIVLLLNKPLIMWSQSIGPLRFKNSKNEDFVRFVLSKSSMFIRDVQSLELIKRFGIKNNKIYKTFESVIGLNDIFSIYEMPSERENILGISVYSAQVREFEAHTDYINRIAELADHAIRRGFKIHFFPMLLINSRNDDRPLIREIVGCSKYQSQCIIEDHDMDTPDHLAKIAKCKIFVGHKTHSVIFALVSGTPLIAIAYHKKTEDFMKQYDLQRYCISDSNLTKEILIQAFDNITAELDAVGIQEFEKSREYGKIVQSDFSRMLKV